jgi:heterodisulfide reductase subunit C|tara:strand:- start:385 stop:669 length:285 start_codon:yes stop_codon:yes gene_type:complete
MSKFDDLFPKMAAAQCCICMDTHKGSCPDDSGFGFTKKQIMKYCVSKQRLKEVLEYIKPLRNREEDYGEDVVKQIMEELCLNCGGELNEQIDSI